jgi:MFS family permease
MQGEALDGTKNTRIRFRLWWVGLLAIIASVAANVLVRALAGATLDLSPDSLELLDYGGVIGLTVLGVLGAVIVFALLERFARRPILMFERIAAVVLVLSFVPDVLLLVASVPGATAVSVGVLMSMHVVAWAISVGLLSRFAPPDVQRRRK